MALVPYVDGADLDIEYRDLLARPINLFRSLANSPEGFAKSQAFGEWIRWDCELGPLQCKLLILAVGYLASSPYEFSHHIALNAQFGVTDDDISALIDYLEQLESSLPTDDRLLADAARELTMSRTLSSRTASALTGSFSPGE